MNFRTYILPFVMALPLFVAHAETGSYSKAEAELKAKNQIALQNLANVSEKIKNEKFLSQPNLVLLKGMFLKKGEN